MDWTTNSNCEKHTPFISQTNTALANHTQPGLISLLATIAQDYACGGNCPLPSPHFRPSSRVFIVCKKKTLDSLPFLKLGSLVPV